MMTTYYKPISVKDTVHKLQLFLLQGIHNENQLYAAGSLMSRSDYNDVVTERSIAHLCGYPLCSNPLPSDRPRKGRYRISLKEHKVYDLHETYMYCSSGCVINSKTFAGSLQEERCSVLDSTKIERVLRLFQDLGSKGEVGLGKDVNLGLSGLKIEEKAVGPVGKAAFEQWIGPSNAIEGYVPRSERLSKPLAPRSPKQGSKANDTKTSSGKHILINDMDFMSTIITNDEYCVSKMPSRSTETRLDVELREPKGNLITEDAEDQLSVSAKRSFTSTVNDSQRKSIQQKEESSKAVIKDDIGVRVLPSTSVTSQKGSWASTSEADDKSRAENKGIPRRQNLKSSLKASGKKKLGRSVTWADDKTDKTQSRNLSMVRKIEDVTEDVRIVGSLHETGARKVDNSVTCANQKIDRNGNKHFTEIGEMIDLKEGSATSCNKDMGDNDDMLRFASAEACAVALSDVSEAVASGNSDVSDAMSEAGIIVLPSPKVVDEGETSEDIDALEPEEARMKLPRKPGIPNFDFFDSEDSWFDAPPEGFSLTLSPFAMMWNAIFAWTTSSTLAFIYGKDESFHEEYLFVNGMEYPRKVVLEDGRSTEIKDTLAGSLARALPGVVADLRLPIPISNLEQGMASCTYTIHDRKEDVISQGSGWIPNRCRRISDYERFCDTTWASTQFLCSEWRLIEECIQQNFFIFRPARHFSRTYAIHHRYLGFIVPILNFFKSPIQTCLHGS